MANVKLKISEATEIQLREFCENSLGIPVADNASVNSIKSKIAAAWGKDEIIVSAPENQAVADKKQKGKTEPVQIGKPKTVKLIIHTSEGVGGEEPVPLGVNGRFILAPRGVEIEIAARYFEVLEHAITYKYESLADGNLNPVPRKMPLYPFQRVA